MLSPPARVLAKPRMVHGWPSIPGHCMPIGQSGFAPPRVVLSWEAARRFSKQESQTTEIWTTLSILVCRRKPSAKRMPGTQTFFMIDERPRSLIPWRYSKCVPTQGERAVEGCSTSLPIGGGWHRFHRRGEERRGEERRKEKERRGETAKRREVRRQLPNGRPVRRDGAPSL